MFWFHFLKMFSVFCSFPSARIEGIKRSKSNAYVIKITQTLYTWNKMNRFLRKNIICIMEHHKYRRWNII